MQQGIARIAPMKLITPQIEELSPRLVAYVRHQGYSREIGYPWQLLRAWAHQQSRPFSPQIGLHHSNPAWIPLKHCRYVACIGIDQPIMRRGPVNSLTIPGGAHGKFSLSGCYGELLPWISKILQGWLPGSGWKLHTTPAFALYHRNHFIELMKNLSWISSCRYRCTKMRHSRIQAKPTHSTENIDDHKKNWPL